MIKITLPASDFKEDILIAGILDNAGGLLNLATSAIEFKVKENKITLVATNYQQTFKSSYPNEKQTTEFNYFLDTKKLLKFVKKMKFTENDNITINFDQKAEIAILTHENFKLRLNITPVTNPTERDEFTPILTKTISVSELRRLKEIAKVFSGELNYSEMVSGIWIKREKNKTIFVITDKKMIYCKEIAEKIPKDFDTIIPNDFIKIACAYSKNEIELNVAKKYSSFRFGNRLITTSNFNANLPNSILGIINTFSKTDVSITFVKKDIQEAFYVLKPFKNNIIPVLGIHFQDDGIAKFSCEDAELNIPFQHSSSAAKNLKDIRINIDAFSGLVKETTEKKDDKITFLFNQERMSLLYLSKELLESMIIMLMKPIKD